MRTPAVHAFRLCTQMDEKTGGIPPFDDFAIQFLDDEVTIVPTHDMHGDMVTVGADHLPQEKTKPACEVGCQQQRAPAL